MDWFAAVFRARGGRALTTCLLVCQQQGDTNREGSTIGYNPSSHLAVVTLHAM